MTPADRADQAIPDRADRVYVALGTNMSRGDWTGRTYSGAGLLAAACDALDNAGLIVRRRSHAWRSAAWPDPTQPPFTNAVVEIAPGDLTPQQVMARLHRTERMFGRKREVRNAPRTLDLDLIAWGNAVISDPKTGLVVPHPRLHLRAFVLAPLSELNPKWWHPSYDVAITSLLLQAQVELPAVRTKDSDKLAQNAK